MSDIRPAIREWQKRIGASTGRGVAVLVGVVAVVLALGLSGTGIRNLIIHSQLAASAPGGTGTAWVVTFVLLLIPGLLFTVACAVFVSSYRAWTFVLVSVSLALVVLAAGSAFPLRDRNEPPVQPLTEILLAQGAPKPAAMAITDALWMGLLALAVLLVGAICWSLTLVYAKKPAATTRGVMRAYAWIAFTFRWAYPVALVVAVPLVVLNIVWNTK